MNVLSWFSTSNDKGNEEKEEQDQRPNRKRSVAIDEEQDSEIPPETPSENLRADEDPSENDHESVYEDAEEGKSDENSELDEEDDVVSPDSDADSERKQEDKKEENNQDATQSDESPKLHKSSRLRGYITLTLASFIHYDTADNSYGDDFAHVSVIPSTLDQRRYSVSVALVSLILSAACLLVHLDRITPLRRVWSAAFGPGSKWEGALLLFLTIWWTVATGVETAISGIAGDGRGQFSLYYSSWVCSVTCYWMLERWLVDAGWSSLMSFIASWPNRSPAWICTAVLSLATLVWYLDLWRNHVHLKREEEQLIVQHLGRVSPSQWRWLVFVVVLTLIPSVVFSLAELVRGSNADGSITKKSPTETVIEGVFFLILTIAWIPTVLMATTPRGAASLIGNSYFFTWIMAIVVVEGLVWFIHDKRQETYQALREKQREYQQRQERVAAQTVAIHAKKEKLEFNIGSTRRERAASSDLFDMRALRSAFSF